MDSEVMRNFKNVTYLVTNMGLRDASASKNTDDDNNCCHDNFDQVW